MTTYLEDQLINGMREETAGVTLTTDVLGAAKQRHRRRVTTLRGAYAVGVIGLAGAVAAVLAVGGGPAPGGTGGSGTGRPPVASAETPQLRLVAALAASEQTSYRIKVTERWAGNSVTTTEGAFDPATDTGYLNSKWSGASVVYLERLVAGARFVSSSGSKGWKPEPGKFDRLRYDRNLGGAASTSADPGALFALLRKAGAKITQTGADKYHFVASVDRGDPMIKNDGYVGDVALDAQKRIARITYAHTVTIEKKGITDTSDTKVTIEFSGYGEPVKVELPAK